LPWLQEIESTCRFNTVYLNTGVCICPQSGNQMGLWKRSDTGGNDGRWEDEKQ